MADAERIVNIGLTVTANTQSAADSFKALTDSLKALQNMGTRMAKALSDSLASMSGSVEKLQAALSSFQSDADRVTALNDSLMALRRTAASLGRTMETNATKVAEAVQTMSEAAALMPNVESALAPAAAVRPTTNGTASTTNGRSGSGHGRWGSAFGMFVVGGSLQQYSRTLIGLGSAAFTMANQFDSAMRNVWTETDWTQQKFQQWSNVVLNLSKQVPFTATELANALYPIYAAGYQGAQGLQVLQAAAKGAVAGNVNLQDATTGLLTILAAFHIPASQAQHVLDMMVKTTHEGIISFPQLSTSLGRVASVAAAMKVPLQQVLGAFAALTTSGLPAKQAETGLEQLITHMTKWTTTQIKQFGKNTYNELQQVFAQQGLVGALSFLNQVSGGNPKVLQQLIPDIRAYNTALILSRSNYGQIANAVGNSQGYLNRAFGEQMASNDNQIKQLKADLAALAVEFTKMAQPILAVVLPALRGLLSWFNNLSPGMKQFLAVVLAVTGAVAALAAPVLFMMATLSLLGAAAAPIMIVIGAVMALGIAIVELAMHWRQITDAGNRAITAFANWTTTIMNNVVTGLQNAVRAVGTWFSGLVGSAENAFGSLGRFFSNLAHEAVTWGENLIHSFVQGITNSIHSVEQAVGNVANSVMKFLGFHSPTEAGPGAEADVWAPNFIRMYVEGLRRGIPQFQAVGQQLAGALGAALGGSALPSTVGTAGSARGSVVIQVDVHDNVTNDKALADRIKTVLASELRANGVT